MGWGVRFPSASSTSLVIQMEEKLNRKFAGFEELFVKRGDKIVGKSWVESVEASHGVPDSRGARLCSPVAHFLGIGIGAYGGFPLRASLRMTGDAGTQGTDGSID